VVSEPHPLRRRMAAEQGCDPVIDPTQTDLVATVMELTHGIGADITFEVAGLGSTVDQAITVTRRGGRIVQVGVPTDSVTVDIRKIIIGELQLIGEHATRWDFGTAIELIRSGRIDTTSLITHTLPLAQAIEGMRIAMHGTDVMKVVLLNES
jgi:(R,R)-butanediol dehydrogenase/meso-butanediol dehydrogenase/diacetyl reductase